MAGYDSYDHSRRILRGEDVDEWDPRYFDSHGNLRDSYQAQPQPYTTHTTHTTQLVPRGREDSGLSAESGRRDLLVPVDRDGRRTRSAEPGYVHEDYEYRRSYGPRHDSRYDREYDREYERRVRRSDKYHEDDNRSERSERKQKHSSGLSTQEKIIAAVAGAALLAGGKELYDRREAKEERTEVQRNPLASAALAGFGALAAYQGAEFYSKQQAKKDRKANYILHRGRDGEMSEYYSDDEDYNSKEKKGHKNFLESALAATGLSAAVKSLTGGVGDDRRSDTRSRGGSPTPSRASSRGGSKGHNKVQKAAIASLLAGATEAFRVAKEPGGWRGEKTKRILTAAAGAATVDAAHGADHGKLGLAESVIGGLVGNRLINGSKNEIEEDKLTGRSRSRSRARSRGSGGGGTGLAALATAGLGALGAKKALDHSRSRSRGRGNYDSRSPSRDRRYERSRSRSVVDKARDGLAKLGIGSGAMVAADETRRRDREDSYDQGSRRPQRRDDSYDGSSKGHRRNQSYGSDRGHRERSAGDRSRDRHERKERRSGYGSESDLGDSDEDERRAKKMRGKQLVTTGLAAVATVHAANEVYHSMEKRKARQKAVKQGRLSEHEAKKLKSKAIMQDAAAVGIAAMGIKGALSELQSARQLTRECSEFKQEKAKRHEKRLERERRKKLGDRRRSASWDSPSRSPYAFYNGAGTANGPHYIDDNPYSATRFSAPPMRRGTR
ncbi:hypothetical protein PT974_11773 [Cladobotryum mycophilum]|uniref:DUF3824 domain-containing protein n=1 Tax=Cladobotryum mycophilum TaxID=491253 RepID=A0ABR0S664_9HYPO